MANLVEEPIAAALVSRVDWRIRWGQVLLVDMGGGTLDVCVLKAQPGVNRFTIYASNGRADLGGDRYTDLIFEHLLDRLAELARAAGGPAATDHARRTRLWQVAEPAKRDLVEPSEVRVRLPDAGGVAGATVTVERTWFEKHLLGSCCARWLR